MKTIEITRDALGTLIADEAKWYAKATELEAANARLRDELQGVTNGRNSFRGRLEELEKRHEREVTKLRDALCKMLAAKTKDARKDAEKEAKQALSATEPVPFLPAWLSDKEARAMTCWLCECDERDCQCGPPVRVSTDDYKRDEEEEEACLSEQ